LHELLDKTLQILPKLLPSIPPSHKELCPSIRHINIELPNIPHGLKELLDIVKEAYQEALDSIEQISHELALRGVVWSYPLRFGLMRGSISSLAVFLDLHFGKLRGDSNLGTDFWTLLLSKILENHLQLGFEFVEDCLQSGLELIYFSLESFR